MGFRLESRVVWLVLLSVPAGCGRTTRDSAGQQPSMGGAAGAATSGNGGTQAGNGGAASGGSMGGGASGSGAGRGGAAGATSAAGASIGGASGGEAGSSSAGTDAGGMGGEGPLQIGELCSEDEDCISGICHMASENDVPVPPRTCDYCLESFRYDQWCDDDVDCCPGLTCGYGELAGLCVMN